MNNLDEIKVTCTDNGKSVIGTLKILLPNDYVGPVMTLTNEKRGIQKNMQYLVYYTISFKY